MPPFQWVLPFDAARDGQLLYTSTQCCGGQAQNQNVKQCFFEGRNLCMAWLTAMAADVGFLAVRD